MYLNSEIAPTFYFLAAFRIPFSEYFSGKKRNYIISGKGQLGPKQHKPDSAEKPLEADLPGPPRVTMRM